MSQHNDTTPTTPMTFEFPDDEAILMYRMDQINILAIVAPTLTPGFRHFGVFIETGRFRKFINGPLLVREETIWQRLKELSDEWEGCEFEPHLQSEDWDMPAQSLGQFKKMIAEWEAPIPKQSTEDLMKEIAEWEAECAEREAKLKALSPS